ncbi:MAG TPA: hypothetical protein PLB16_01615 [bacterium]|nr:hypothetical protein [bacterium]
MNNLKRTTCFVVVIVFLILHPFNAEAGMLKLLVSYKKGIEKAGHKTTEIVDGYWRFPVLEVPKPLEREKYSFVIEGYQTIKNVNETLELIGAGISRSNILLPTEGVLTIENREDFPRKINILKEGENSEKVELTVPAKGSITHVFSSSGDYTLVDTLFQWNTVYVRVLQSTYLFVVNEGSSRIEIPDIAPGTYTVRVYYGIRWVYQEDFVMISNAAQNIGYRIEDGTVYSINSTSYSTTISMPGD